MSNEQGQSAERELGRRLAALREAAGLTQRELARRLGIGQSALSRIESGQRRLSAAQVAQVAQVLGIDPGMLLEPGVAESNAAAYEWRRRGPARHGQVTARSQPAPAPRRRPLREGTSADRPMVQAAQSAPESGALMEADAMGAPAAGRGALIRPGLPTLEPALFAEVVGDALEVEALAGALETRRNASPATERRRGQAPGAARSPGRDVRPSAFETLPPTVQTDPVRLARFWRHELGVGDEGPLPDLVPLLEAAGVDVVHARLDVSVPEGACALVPRPWPDAPPRAFVFINGRERPVVMQRFALAHEFAHLALGHGEAYDERIDWSGRSRRETDANAFAEEFVAPLAAVRRWAELTAPSSDDPVDTVVHLGNHFGVSVRVARNRLRAADLVSGSLLQSLDRQLRDRGDTLIPRQPFLGGLRDTLSVLATESRPGAQQNPWRVAPQGVRVPGRMREHVLALLEADAAPPAEAAKWLRIDRADLGRQLDQLEVQ